LIHLLSTFLSFTLGACLMSVIIQFLSLKATVFISNVLIYPYRNYFAHFISTHFYDHNSLSCFDTCHFNAVHLMYFCVPDHDFVNSLLWPSFLFLCL
jgi:hypothetical protein